MLLAREMEHQRMKHEESLRKLRDFMRDEAIITAYNPSTNISISNPINTGNALVNKSSRSVLSSSQSHSSEDTDKEMRVTKWLTRVHHQLHLERSRINKMAENTRMRLEAVEQEYADLMEMNRGLRDNEKALRAEADGAEARLLEMESSHKYDLLFQLLIYLLFDSY
jgi:hypothetical protein